VNRRFGSPERERLAGAIAETRIRLNLEAGGIDPGESTKPWVHTADEFLTSSEQYLDARNIHQGWVSLTSAQRAILSHSDDPEVERAAIALWREANKVTGWRAKAIGDLICSPKGELLPELRARPIPAESRERVISAVALRDDEFHTTYFKILLRRRHLFQLFLFLWLGVALCLLLSVSKVLPAPFDDPQQVAAVILFGALGAGLSVGQGLLAADVSARIPAQLIGSFVVWMRPGIGAVAALTALALLHANKTLQVLGSYTSEPGVVLAVAFAAGFSERFIVGAIERISQASSKASSA
jgi:uncharacterized membrane protein